jgi:hypothetical protein
MRRLDRCAGKSQAGAFVESHPFAENAKGWGTRPSISTSISEELSRAQRSSRLEAALSKMRSGTTSSGRSAASARQVANDRNNWRYRTVFGQCNPGRCAGNLCWRAYMLGVTSALELEGRSRRCRSRCGCRSHLSIRGISDRQCPWCLRVPCGADLSYCGCQRRGEASYAASGTIVQLANVNRGAASRMHCEFECRKQRLQLHIHLRASRRKQRTPTTTTAAATEATATATGRVARPFNRGHDHTRWVPHSSRSWRRVGTMRAAALVLISAGNLILQTASYPPLPKTQGRGTHSFGPGKKSDAENLGHPPVCGIPPFRRKRERMGHPAASALRKP